MIIKPISKIANTNPYTQNKKYKDTNQNNNKYKFENILKQNKKKKTLK